VRFFDPESRPKYGWRARGYAIIFETDTRAGMLFDITLLGVILLSIIVVSLETVQGLAASQVKSLRITEWVLTGLFTVEYIARIVVVKDKRRYVLSLMGLVDLIALLPTYLSLLFLDAQALQIIRALRLLRVFRVLELGPLADEGSSLVRALLASRHKIMVFMATMLIVVVIQGALLYFIEHQINPGFSSIPRSIYWAIVTLTTVGYGDIAPVSVPGQFIASLLMLFGYGIIAVPTGIVGAEVALAELIRRRMGSEAEQVVLPSPAGVDPSNCAGGVPASAIVGGPAHANVTTQERD